MASDNNMVFVVTLKVHTVSASSSGRGGGGGGEALLNTSVSVWSHSVPFTIMC